MKLGYRTTMGVRGIGDNSVGSAGRDGARRAGRRPAALATLALSALIATLTAATVARAEACPNETLRLELHSAALPDCRAYERVTPAYRESQPALVGGLFAVSPDGDRVLAGSIGAFAGTEQDPVSIASNVVGAAYLYERTGAGWQAWPLDPAASRFFSNGLGLADASTDLGRSLWELEPTGAPLESSASFESEEVTGFYLESSAGVFEKVGPSTPGATIPNRHRYHYLGGSENLSRIVFTAESGVRWPFDATVAEEPTVYEYVGVERPGETREPSLVGVEGGAGSSRLISTCGTRLGSGWMGISGEQHTGSMFNAISASGLRVFFTAIGSKEVSQACVGPRAGEVYAREEITSLEGDAPAAGARTVAISEPSREDCRECQTEEPSVVRAAAAFQGASLDGSRVFFTTEQELLPGAKGNNLYEYDFDAPAGERVALLSGAVAGGGEAQVQGVARISEDGSAVYFVARGRLGSEPRGGGCVAGLTETERAVEEATHEGRCRAKQGADNLYLHSGGRTVFVATLAPGDAKDWSAEDSRPVLASEGGSYLVLTSGADLLGEGIAEGKPQVFQYQAANETLVRASIGANGYNNNNRQPLVGSTIIEGPPQGYSYGGSDSPTQAAGIEAPADGAVFFRSPDALTLQALADQPDSEGVALAQNVYEYRGGRVYLLSDGRDLSTVSGSSGTGLVASTPSGGDVFLFTSDPLVPGDGDTQSDLYDARADGGFLTPGAPAGCGPGACQEAPVSPPALGTPASLNASGEGNISAPVPRSGGPTKRAKRAAAKCARGRRRVRGRCVAKHTKTGSAGTHARKSMRRAGR